MADKKQDIQAVIDGNEAIESWNKAIRKHMGCEETLVDWDEFEAKVLNGQSEPEKEKKRPIKQFSIADMEVK